MYWKNTNKIDKPIKPKLASIKYLNIYKVCFAQKNLSTSVYASINAESRNSNIHTPIANTRYMANLDQDMRFIELCKRDETI